MRPCTSTCTECALVARRQVPLPTVLEEVSFERVRGRSPLFQSWFDIQPVSLEGSASLDLDGLQTPEFREVSPG